jgi:Flp pilus assembly protein TadG
MSTNTRLRGDRVRAGRRTRSEEGQALFEFAICMPVLMLIVTGMFTFGVALHDYLELAEAASVGGEILSISRGQTADACATAASAIANAAPLLNSAKLTYAFVINGASYGSSCNTGTYAAAALQPGQPATATVTYPCSLSWYGSLFPNCTLTAQVTELVQ